ncbi:type IX secretion system anionic LPS delivery protein PorZ [Dinghuibacter silviterrae]|uniref:Two component regulator with propeller domain n=1 Tax=Dinghuibacter silviterrae TaxID=1539049 RepID=A0A4R8DPY9_9BACT|nr:two-component regulator propeller domain-containing protein [Dinghuibacter silviterrae]TDW99474.1 two component regulator with propeller domain [Dinghuibacter silviterrae]
MRAAFLCLVFLPVFGLAQLPPIGAWREHLSYHHARAIAGSPNDFFVATPSSVFNVSGEDNAITRYSTINGLHSIGISAIGSGQGVLVIGYNNSDVDILSGASITEVPDLEISPVSGDKTIHGVFVAGDNAYLSTGLGIVVVGIDEAQVQATYVIGPGGSQVPVFGVASDSLYWYAATGSGLRKALRTTPNLEDFNNWQQPTGDANMDVLSCQAVVSGNGKVYVLRGDSLFVSIGGSWSTGYNDGWNISGIQVAGDSLVISEQDPTGTTGRILWWSDAGGVTKTLTVPGLLVDPRAVLQGDAGLWIADAQRGLQEWNGTTLVPLVPNSPDGPLDGQMVDAGSGLWVAGGGTSSDTSGFYHFADNIWTDYNSITQPLLTGVRNVGTIAVDPRGDTVFAGASTGGLIRVSGNALRAGGAPVTGLTFDLQGNLWVVNGGALQPLTEYRPDGSAASFNLPVVIPGNQLGQVIADDYGYLWIKAPPGNGALCFNPATQQWKPYLTGSGQGNLPDATVNSIITDKQGLVWIGTNNGIGVVECGASIFSGGCDVTLPVVQQDAFAGYLFQGQEVLCMAVDGADRKWVGTPSGAWLISEDGEQVIATYNTANSPLFNDTVNAIGIDGKTGEVFFSTPAGMCSFRGSATDASQTQGSLLVFPNPVPPGYTGTIAIRGVPDGAVVKIAELSGRLVYQTVALGGQAVWNGNDHNGQRVATGVYLVLIASRQDQERVAAKIAIIR